MRAQRSSSGLTPPSVESARIRAARTAASRSIEARIAMLATGRLASMERTSASSAEKLNTPELAKAYSQCRRALSKSAGSAVHPPVSALTGKATAQNMSCARQISTSAATDQPSDLELPRTR